MYLLLMLCFQLGGAHEANEAYASLPNVVWPPYPDVPLTTGNIDYQVGNTTFQGFYAFPTTLNTLGSAKVSLPGLFIAHQYLGLGNMEKFRACEMASRGYVVLAVDLYGKDPNRNADQARSMMGQLRANPAELKKRITGSWNALKKLVTPPAIELNTSQLFATGYCFGGGIAFELARMDLDGLVAVAGFHPSFTPLFDRSGYPPRMRAAVQAHHAQMDSSGDQGLLGFESEMKNRSVDHWSSHKYGNCAHGWTDPTSSIYRPVEAEEAHAHMRMYFGTFVGRHPDIDIWRLPEDLRATQGKTQPPTKTTVKTTVLAPTLKKAVPKKGKSLL